MLFLTVGTGIGGGLVLDGEIYRGPTGMGAELGHMIVDPLRAAVRVRAATAAWRRSRRARRSRGWAARPPPTDPDGLIARLGRADGVVTGHTVTAAAQQGDPTARDLFARLGRWLGIGIASLATIFELDAVVVGGGRDPHRRPAAGPGPRGGPRVRLRTGGPRRSHRCSRRRSAARRA